MRQGWFRPAEGAVGSSGGALTVLLSPPSPEPEGGAGLAGPGERGAEGLEAPGRCRPGGRKGGAPEVSDVFLPGEWGVVM